MFIGKKLCKNKVCGMTSVIILPMGHEVKVTQKGDDRHSSAIINSALYRAHGGRNQRCAIESTSAPWVILVINVNISLVGLTLLSSMFQISSTMKWHGLEDVEPLQDAKDKGLAQASRSRLYIFYFSDPRSH